MLEVFKNILAPGRGFKLKDVVGLSALAFALKGANEFLEEQPNKKTIWKCALDAGLLRLAYSSICYQERKDDECKSNQKIKERTAAAQAEAEKHKSDCEADAAAYTQKRQADAEMYRAKAEVDVWKADAMKKLHNAVQENLEDEPASEPSVGIHVNEETFMQSFNKSHRMPGMPPLIEDVLKGCPERTKMPLLLATLSELGALCFPRVVTEGWRSSETHSPNLQVVIEGPAGVGKGLVSEVYQNLFQRVIASDEAKSKIDSKEKKNHIIQCVGANMTNARLMKLFRENNGVPIFVFNEEIKDITRSLDKQNGITYDMLRKAFDNGKTDGSSSRGNTDPTPVCVRMNYVFTGTFRDVEDFIDGEVEGGTAARILWGVRETDKKNENPSEVGGSSMESYLDDIDRWRKLYCYTTDSDGNDCPCGETRIDLEYVKKALENWRQKQETCLSLTYHDVRKKVVKRMTSLGLHCAIVLHMLYQCQMDEVEPFKGSVVNAVLYVVEYCMERYIFKFGEEEQAIIRHDTEAEKIRATDRSSTGSVFGQGKDDELTPEIQDKIKSLYIPREFGSKSIAKEINRLFKTNFTPDKVRRYLEREGLYQPATPKP